MKKIVLIILLVFLCACVEEDVAVKKKDVEIQSFKTDKFLYRSREKVNMTVGLESPTKTNASIWVHGIYSSRDRINIKKTVEIDEGFNELVFIHQMPSCTGCSKIYPGNYSIEVVAELLNKTVSRNLTVGIEQ